jgi:multiple sugar transport system permease protein
MGALARTRTRVRSGLHQESGRAGLAHRPVPAPHGSAQPSVALSPGQAAVAPAARHVAVTAWHRTPQGRLALWILLHVFLIAIGLTFLMPFWWMVATSLKPKTAIYHIPPLWLPFQAPDVWDRLVWENYPRAVQFIPFFTYLKNTLVIAVLAALGTFVSCPPVAYSLARIRWPGRNILFGLTLATLFLPYQVTLIPLFLVFRTLGWVGTPLPLIVPHWLGGAFYIFLLRQFFMTIPQELTDAARIDGASEFRIYWNIMLPLAKPALATVIVFEFLRAWRDFLGPLIYLNRKELYTLSLGLQQFRSEFDVEWAMLMAASVLITFPVIIVFFFAQRTFIRGITLTGIKG